MRLPPHLLASALFQFTSLDEFILGLGEAVSDVEIAEIRRLDTLHLPPITSREALATLLGLNPGLIWSFQKRTKRHYRSFSIKKGKGFRQIDAPRVALKILQKWLSIHFQLQFKTHDHVYGFVAKKSYILAASQHCKADWIYSVDIEDFFPSTSEHNVAVGLVDLGYSIDSAKIIASICCLRGGLAQGSPCSPVLSNIVFSKIDSKILDLSINHGINVTRYADDIVFSGKFPFPLELKLQVKELFQGTCWKLSAKKESFSALPNRLKVHGLLVHEDLPRLTKGYRNRIRAFRHMIDKGGVKIDDIPVLRGHIVYGEQIDRYRAKHLK